MNSQTDPIHLNELLKQRESRIPVHAYPKRGSLTINCLLTVKVNNEIKICYHNFDPVNWNEWYPFFSFHHSEIEMEFEKPEDLTGYFEKRSTIADKFVPSRMQSEVAERVKEVLGLDTVIINPVPLLKNDYWLKFSKTRNVWTLYCFVFYCASNIEPKGRLLSIKDPYISLVPIEATTYQGIKVVENTVEILSNKANYDFIVSNAIAL
jgi:hypothetical protein